MKQFKFIGGTVLAILMSGCSDDIVEKQITLPVSGDEIAFGVQSDNFNVPDSRTVYKIPAGESVTNYSKLEIAWVPDVDQVRVYSPQAADGFKWADYTVKQGENESGTFPYLAKNGETGVRWGNVAENHDFYAFYPVNKLTEGLTSDATVKANIPVAQEKGEMLTWEDNVGNVELPEGWKIIRPDMTYAMMAGKGTWTAGTDRNVSLTFTPLVSVVDVVINGPKAGEADMNVYYVSVKSKSKPIVGDFTYNIETGEFGGMPDVVMEDNNIATINCVYYKDGVPTPVTLKSGEVLTVKFFLLPRDIQASELSVSVTLDAGRTLTQNLVPEGSNVQDETLAQGMITRVVTPNLTMPEASNWMGLIGDDVLFTQLSLPGSKHSYTGDLYNSVGHNVNPETDIMQFYQSLYVTDRITDTDETQFDKGIRAFDLKLQVEGGEAYVFAGGDKVNNLTIGDVLNNLLEEIRQSPTECAVVCLNYVNPPSVSEWIDGVVNAVNTWGNNHEKVLAQITPSTTMLDMRSHIAVILNVPDGTIPSGNQINYITNFSSSVQNLEMQDYMFNNTYHVHIQNLYQVNNPSITTPSETYGIKGAAGLVPYYIDKKMHDGVAPTEGYDLISVKERLMKRLFEEARSKVENCLYINDLAGFCVVKNENSTGYVNAALRTWTDGIIDHWDPRDNGPIIGDNREHTFSIPEATYYGSEPSSKSYGETWFDVGDEDGISMGNGGNTGEFAERFNLRALNAVYDMVNEGRVPIGLVFMNFAGVNQVEIGGKTYKVYGDRLPSLIMSNNFMFPLETASK